MRSKLNIKVEKIKSFNLIHYILHETFKEQLTVLGLQNRKRLKLFHGCSRETSSKLEAKSGSCS